MNQPTLFDIDPLDTVIAPHTLARTGNPDTSHTAAKKASTRGPSQRRRVWRTIQLLGDATDYEIATATGILRSSAAKRRQELVDLGLVTATPARRKTDTGVDAIVWAAIPGKDY